MASTRDSRLASGVVVGVGVGVVGAPGMGVTGTLAEARIQSARRAAAIIVSSGLVYPVPMLTLPP